MPTTHWIKRLPAAIIWGCVVALSASWGKAQSVESYETNIPGVTSPTPEMWFYLQEMRRLQDPATAIRRKAEDRASQRRQRLAAMKWYGFSNLRPQASPSPFTSTYSPYWSGNDGDPYRWIGYSGATRVFVLATTTDE